MRLVCRRCWRDPHILSVIDRDRHVDTVHLLLPNVEKLDGAIDHFESFQHHFFQVKFDFQLSARVGQKAFKGFGDLDESRKISEKCLSVSSEYIVGLYQA